MSQKFNTNTGLSPQELAKHLKKPTGEQGKEVGLQMNKGNKHICLNSYNILKPHNNDAILEIGMGNGFFVKNLMNMAENLTYTGVDFSKTMVQEATELNKDLCHQKTVQFQEASIDNLPFKDNSFDCITTTNTLYFWPKPKQNAQELLRVLKPGGKILIAYRSKSCMDQIELSKYGFEKYESDRVENLLEESGFKEVTTQIINEPDLDFDGTPLKMDGIYTLASK